MDKKEALLKCMKLCSAKEYAPGEISEKLKTWGVNESDSAIIIEQLTSEKFVDEYRFARFYINDKIKFNKWGKIKVAAMLKMKGIGPEPIKQAFEQFDSEKYAQVLEDELIKKRKSIKDTELYILKGKLYQFAAGRGFEGDIIQKVINRMLEK